MKKRILFVDDEPAVLQGLRRSLRGQRSEWDMAFVESGQKALEHLQNEATDVVITDMRMPGMDGAQLLERVAELHPEVIRIVLSGHSDDEMNLRAAGVAHQYLNKPCDTGLLKQTLDRAFGLADLLGDDSLCRFVNGLKQLPSPPATYLALVELMKSPNVSLREIGEAMSSDPAMVAKLMQLANSGFFGVGRRITNCMEAATLIGLDALRALVLTVGVFSQYERAAVSAGGFSARKMLENGLAVGQLARRIAIHEGGPENLGDECFVAGILHDLGILVLDQNLPGKYAEVQRLVNIEEMDWSAAEEQVLGATHAAVGAYLVGLWGLPGRVVEAVAFHHRPSLAASDGFSPLAAVHVADLLVHEHDQFRFGETVQGDEDFLQRLGFSARLDQWRNLLPEE